MLLIRRHAGQSIRIGDEIEILISEVSATRVTIAITAPREVSVSRSEVALTREQNLAASGSLTSNALARIAEELRLAR